MRQIHGPAPNLFRSTIPWRGFGSKDWVPTNSVQRVGAFMIGVIYIMGVVICIASTFWLKPELTASLHSETAAVAIGVVLVSIVLMGGLVVIGLGVRLLRGAFRPSPKRS